MIGFNNNGLSKLKSLFALILTAIAVVLTSCSEEDKLTGNVNVNFSSETFDDGAGVRTVEGLRFGIFPTDFENSFAFDFDAIAVSAIESGSCSFENILIGTYKVGFMEHPRIFKTIQVVPDQTTQVIMLD